MFAGVMELRILWSLNVDEHHECVGEEHAVFAFDSNALSEIFSQAVHEAFNCVIIVLLVVCVMFWNCEDVARFHAVNGEQSHDKRV